VGESVDRYEPIPEQEAFDIEHWSLEEAKCNAAGAEEFGGRGADYRRCRRHRTGNHRAAPA
jgi:hypothetical protein